MNFPRFDKDKEGHKHELRLRQKNPQEFKFIYPVKYEFPKIIRKGILLGTNDGRVGVILDHSHDIEKVIGALNTFFGKEWSKLYKSENLISSQEEYYNALKANL